MRLNQPKNRIWIAAVLLLALLLAGCGDTPKPAATPAPTEAPATPAPTPEPTELPVYPASDTDLTGPAQTPGPETTPPPVTPPPVVVTEPPSGTEKVDDTYFADAAFLGNSLMDGLRLFGKLQYGDFYSGTSASVISVTKVRDAPGPTGAKITKLDALLSKQYGKIYVLFGINELGFQVNAFADMYGELLDQIKAGEPNAKIIVLSLTPITRTRDREDDLFKRARIEAFNAAVAEMATSRGYTYLNLFDALADPEGWLPESQSTDGIHFQASKYLEWADFLRTHFDTEAETDISVD